MIIVGIDVTKYNACWLLAKATLLFVIFLQLTACSNRSAPAPVTTLELRKQQMQQRQSVSLTQSQYVVQRGDTLYSIAFRSGQDFRTLAARNNIRSPYTIFPGQVLQLQDASARAVPASSTVAPRSATNTTKPAKSVAANAQKGYGQINTLPSSSSASSSPAAATGRVTWQWPVRGQILARFSTAEHGSKGLQIAGRDGARINAAADGQVVYAGNALRGYGNLIIIKHNDDYLSAYAHNKRILVKERQNVKAGQQIAEMGDTDTSTTRLHFEIRFRGKSVDPQRYLPK